MKELPPQSEMTESTKSSEMPRFLEDSADLNHTQQGDKARPALKILGALGFCLENEQTADRIFMLENVNGAALR